MSPKNKPQILSMRERISCVTKQPRQLKAHAIKRKPKHNFWIFPDKRPVSKTIKRTDVGLAAEQIC